MARLAQDLIGEIRLGRGAKGPQVRDLEVSARSRFSVQARNLWRVGQGSNAVILKRIHKGGTGSRERLRAQFDYLFQKSEAVFGHLVELTPGQRALDPEERREIAQEWSDGWKGAPKNGHTTHLLLSFPQDLAPKKALHIAETWAMEMFQSGLHADDEWAYVAALHTDRSHPHVHIVVNNRGLESGEWFFMAREHVFNLTMMKERVAGIAAEIHVDLDISSRLDRGILTYGPSRAEIEAARRERRPVFEKMREGKALEDGLAAIGKSRATLRMLSSIAGLVELTDIATRMERAAELLETGGILTPQKLEIMNMDLTQATTRRELDAVFASWLESTEREIDRLAPEDRREMREDLAEIIADIIRDLGDARGAELVQRAPQSELYRTQLEEGEISRDSTAKHLSAGVADELRASIITAAHAVGIDRDVMARRLEHPAANAWQEREWVKADLRAASRARGLDLEREADRHKAAEIVDRFYATAAKSLNAALEIEDRHQHKSDRLTRTLGMMAQVNRQHGQVSFEYEDDAARFTADLKDRYGAHVVQQLASGETQALAVDFPDPGKRREIAQAIIAAAKSHESIGLTRREVALARERLQERSDDVHERRDRDYDLDL